MAILLDCGKWKVMVDQVYLDDDGSVCYDNILCVYDLIADTSCTGKLATNTVYNLIPSQIFIEALKRAVDSDK